MVGKVIYIPLPHPCIRHLARKYPRDSVERTCTELEDCGLGWNASLFRGSGIRMECQEQGGTSHCGRICTENSQKVWCEDDGERPLHRPCRSRCSTPRRETPLCPGIWALTAADSEYFRTKSQIGVLITLPYRAWRSELLWRTPYAS